MKLPVILFSLITFCALTFACSSQAVTSYNKQSATKQIKNNSFSKVDISGDAKVLVNFIQGGKCSATIKSDKSVIGDIKATVDNGTLKVSYKKPQALKYQTVTIQLTIQAPRLEKYEASSSNVFTSKSISQRCDLDIDLSGASTFTVNNLKCSELDFDVSGASTINVGRASASEIDLDLSGASKIAGHYTATQSISYDVSGACKLATSNKAGKIDLDLSGSSKGSITVNCSKLKLEASGCSTININGRAQQVTKSISGVSKINTSNLRK